MNSEIILFPENDSIDTLGRKIHEQNRRAGWWNHPQRSFFTTIGLIQSEIFEAFESARKELDDDHLPHRLGLEVELADALIRVLDMGGRYQFKYLQGELEAQRLHMMCYTSPNVFDLLTGLSMSVNRLCECFLNDAYQRQDKVYHIDHITDANLVGPNSFYSMIIDTILFISKHFELDVIAAMVEKFEYNKQRADHKLENRQKEHGKKV